MEIRSFCDFLPSPKLEIKDNGIAEALAKIARVGVQKYFIDGVWVNVLRDEEDVKATASFFNNLPLTLNHPDTGEVTINNREKLIKGWGTQCDFSDGWLTTKIHLFAEDAIIASQTSHQEFSNGYKGQLVEEQGEWVDTFGVMGEVGARHPYQFKQKIIAGNHIALVPNGTARAGANATFVDSILPDGVIMDEVKTKDSAMKNIVSHISDMAKECGYSDFIEEDGFSVPKSMADMVSMYKDMCMGKAKNAVTDSTDWVRVEALKASENKARELETKISLQSVKLQEMQETLANYTNDSYIVDKFTARCNAYKQVAPYVAQEFDPTLSDVDWYKKALSSKQILTDNMSEDEIKSGFNILLQLFKPEAQTASKPVVDNLAELRAAKEAPKVGGVSLPQHRAIKTIV
jgi:hypothetical protein